MTNGIELQDAGARVYAIGNTYPVKGRLRELGAHWDADRKAWWIGAGKRAALAEMLAAAPTAPAAYQAAADEMVAVAGNTYPVREQLRALGGRWDGGSKAWMVPASQAAAASALVATAPKQAFRGRGAAYDPDKFNGYGARRGGYRRACKTGGNCSSFGDGASCGGHDCDGF